MKDPIKQEINELLNIKEREKVSYDKGFQDGKDHSKPSRETSERLIKLETYMEQNTKEHAEIKNLIMEMKADLKEAIEKKAGVWVEKVIIWGGIAIGVGIVSFITWILTNGTIHLIK